MMNARLSSLNLNYTSNTAQDSEIYNKRFHRPKTPLSRSQSTPLLLLTTITQPVHLECVPNLKSFSSQSLLTTFFLPQLHDNLSAFKQLLQCPSPGSQSYRL